MFSSGKTYAQEHIDYTANCAISKGDTIEKVQNYYKYTSQPQVTIPNQSPLFTGVLKDFPHQLPKVEGYKYFHFPEFGVWVFFTMNGTVKNLRFDPPFRGSVHGVSLGETLEMTERKFGKPKNVFSAGAYELFFEQRDNKIRSIIDGLPDPASKSLIARAFDQVQKLYTTLPPDVEARVLNTKGGAFLRIDIDPDTKRVYKIFSDSCGIE
jgi:hypothetical protein